jgi:hypothetical protein
MNKDEALRLALEALEADELAMIQDKDGHMVYLKDQAITAIKEALAQPWEKFCDSNCVWTDHHPDCKLAQPEHGWTPERIAGMERLKEAQDKKLAQLEPVAWEQFYPEMGKPKLAYLLPTESPENACYIPPQRTWVGLTDEDKDFIVKRASVYDWHDYEVIEATEAKLKEKNT